jgi:hypothetical protein
MDNQKLINGQSPEHDEIFLGKIAHQFNVHLGLEPPINSNSTNLAYLKKELHEALDLCMSLNQFNKKMKNKK